MVDLYANLLASKGVGEIDDPSQEDAHFRTQIDQARTVEVTEPSFTEGFCYYYILLTSYE